jgi:hypothetical protein
LYDEGNRNGGIGLKPRGFTFGEKVSRAFFLIYEDDSFVEQKQSYPTSAPISLGGL